MLTNKQHIRILSKTMFFTDDTDVWLLCAIFINFNAILTVAMKNDVFLLEFIFRQETGSPFVSKQVDVKVGFWKIDKTQKYSISNEPFLGSLLNFYHFIKSTNGISDIPLGQRSKTSLLCVWFFFYLLYIDEYSKINKKFK